MASSNLPSKRNKKKNPTVTRLSFECSGGSTEFIDIGLALSIINRKFFRAGLYYYVNSVEVYNNETGVVDFHTAPDNWITRNAHTRGSRIFDKMNELVDPPLSHGVKPRYHDFKVFLTDLHRTSGSLRPSLHGINGAATQYSADDWEYSKFVSADDDQDPVANADEFYAHLLGAHSGSASNWTSIGLIESYEDSRAQVPDTSPTVPVDLDSDPLVNIFDFSSEEQFNDIMSNLRDDNDAPPYNADNYVGSAGHMQHVARIGTEIGVGRVGRASGFCAPFGLICVDPHGVSTAFRVVINLAVGDYKGVYAERA